MPIKTDNSTAEGIMNNKIKQRMSKAMDKRFYWVQDRCEQGQFRLYWAPGAVNLADYFSKYHPIHWYRAVRPIYCYIEGESPDSLQGCVEILKRAKHRHSKAIDLLAQKARDTVTTGITNSKVVTTNNNGHSLKGALLAMATRSRQLIHLLIKLYTTLFTEVQL